MSRIKLDVDSPHTKPWLEPIGKIVLNCGAIETQSYLWIGDLAASDRLAFDALDWPLKQRVEQVLALVDSSVKDGTLRQRCHDAWNEVLEIAKERNAIVHNPIIFGWSSGRNEGPPDLIGIPDVQHLGSKPRVTRKVASLGDVTSLVNRSAATLRALFELREQYLKERDGDADTNVA